LDQRAIIDVICRAGAENLGGEIGALLGQTLSCTVEQLDIFTKEQLFSDPSRPKSTLTRMSVSGDTEGLCYLINPTATAAILGGTLIMLPEDMIEEHASNEKLDGELEDAFSEVANIIAGVFTQAFVDKYKGSLRFIKNSVEELIPTKIDCASNQPFPPGNYYLTKCSLNINEQDLGALEFIVPAAVFALEEESPADTEAPSAEPAEVTAPAQSGTKEPESPATAEQPPEPSPAPQKRAPFAEAKKLTDVVFTAVVKQLGEEVGALLGQPLKCSDLQLLVTSKEEIFSSHCQKKSILTQIQVTGDRDGLGFLLTEVPDAIIMGGTLIMLPEDQIEELRSKGEFDGEVADSFGEIVNIIAGSLTQVFLDRYPQHLRYVKTTIETLVPTKIDLTSDQPFPQGDYYLASFSIDMEGQELNRALLIFPAEIFALEGETNKPTSAQQATASNQPAPGEWGGAPAEETVHSRATASDQPAPGEWGGPPAKEAVSARATAATEISEESASDVATAPPSGDPLVLIISDQEDNTGPFAQKLSAIGYKYQVIGYQDDIKGIFQQHNIAGIFLLMAKVGEKGFAAAIKMQSTGKTLPPVIFAGPDWTKTSVLRAIKYGAKDILVLPASDNEIQDKISAHIKNAS
jgi:CheY-like chemotaxis protein